MLNREAEHHEHQVQPVETVGTRYGQQRQQRLVYLVEPSRPAPGFRPRRRLTKLEIASPSMAEYNVMLNFMLSQGVRALVDHGVGCD